MLVLIILLNVRPGDVRRFDRVKSEWGFSKFLSLEDFNQPTNGYLVKDTCFVGAEVYVIHSLGVGKCLSLEKFENLSYKHTWKLSRISECSEKYGGYSDLCWYSDEFYVGSYKWYFLLAYYLIAYYNYPKHN